MRPSGKLPASSVIQKATERGEGSFSLSSSVIRSHPLFRCRGGKTSTNGSKGGTIGTCIGIDLGTTYR